MGGRTLPMSDLAEEVTNMLEGGVSAALVVRRIGVSPRTIARSLQHIGRGDLVHLFMREEEILKKRRRNG